VSAGAPERRWWILLALASYVAAYSLFFPGAFLIVDEERYVAQALAFADVSRVIEGAGRSYIGMPFAVMSDYPLGTSFLQTPFVALGGWRAATLASVVALIVATLVTARWLHEQGREPAFALLLPGFLPASLFARIGMSDVPSAMVVAIALWLLWRAERGDWRVAVAAGLVAGASVLFREFNVLLLAPFAVGALVRGRAVRWALVAGGVVGLALRPALWSLVFGDAWYVRDSIYGFSLSSISFTALPWAIALMVLVPGALLLPVLYRGERRAEFGAALVLYVGAHLLYGYDAISENGPGKGVLLMSRYAIPALPVIAVMAAEVWPRLLAALTSRVAAARFLPQLAVAYVVALPLFVLTAADSQERAGRIIRVALYDYSAPDVPVLVNELAMEKYASPVYGRRALLYRRDLDTLSVAAIGARHAAFTLALLDRNDSEMFRADAVKNEEFLQRLADGCTVHLMHESEPAAWGRFRVFTVLSCA